MPGVMAPDSLPGEEPAAGAGQGTSLVGVPAWLLAGSAFNDEPRPLHITGVREAHPELFRRLEDSPGATDGAYAYRAYMEAAYGLGCRARRDARKPARYRSDYLRLLQGWCFDSNGVEGAVLKGWVESRFGLPPTFHRERLGRYPSPAWTRYLEEKMSGRFHNNGINQQLDLLYEYCQWMIARHFGGGTHFTLYRGVNDFSGHDVVERLGKRSFVIRQNNLVSFTSRRETAGEFGDTILEARVPLAKVLVFNALLPGSVLKGEGEYLVIGGDYRMEARYW